MCTPDHNGYAEFLFLPPAPATTAITTVAAFFRLEDAGVTFRMLPDVLDLPPYTYVPGHAPHPISDPDGHMREVSLPDTWTHPQQLQWGRRLFEHGYYWEAHEAWEHLWLELGRTSPVALTVKGLIKLAASGVKCREGNAVGARRHASRAAELLAPAADPDLFADWNLHIARESARQLAQSPPVDHVAPSDQPVPLPGMQI